MARTDSISGILKHGLCISCGACVSAAREGAAEMVLDEKSGIFVPRVIDAAGFSGRGTEFEVCPGRGMPINAMARELYGSAGHESFELGRYRLAVVSHSTEQRILENASSGGVMTAIAGYLLEKGLVDGVTASRMIYGAPGPRTESLIARGLEQLLSAQGSKYCPTTTNQLVAECRRAGGRYLFLGTPCQVGALRLAVRQDPALEAVFPYTMSNFCGGYRDFRSLDTILKSHHLVPAEVEYFRFRGGGQPGSMLVRTRVGREVSEAYPNYARRSLVAKQRRCWYCVDATGELADFACGDAWIDRYLDDEYSWSIILARSEFAERTVNELSQSGRLQIEQVSEADVCKSQANNLESKKFRQHARMRVSGLLGLGMPQWDVELPRGRGSYLRELCVLLGKTRSGQLIREVMHSLRKKNP